MRIDRDLLASPHQILSVTISCREIDMKSSVILEMRDKSTFIRKVLLDFLPVCCQYSPVCCLCVPHALNLFSKPYVLFYNLWCIHFFYKLSLSLTVFYMYMQLCILRILYVTFYVQTTNDVIVGQTRDRVNEFVYDYSYWSLDSTSANHTSQEQVMLTPHLCCDCSTQH